MLCMVGFVGLYMVGYIDELVKCEIELLLLLGNIFEFNKYEFSCVMCKEDCCILLKVYFYIGLYLGGLLEIKNINGVGDGVFFVLLYDMVVNVYY